MRTLIVGVGALGGVIAGRLLDAGGAVELATRDSATAGRLQASGLRVSGIGGQIVIPRLTNVAPLDAYAGEQFDLIVLATKAHDAMALAPRARGMLGQTGVLLPIQNGGVSQLLHEAIAGGRVLAGLSNLGATMISPGVYEQRNAGHLLIGEIEGGRSDRAESVERWLGRAVDVRVSHNIPGAIWSKLLLNCSVTTLGAVAGRTMRNYITAPRALDIFERTYDEALSVALATGTRPERMLVDPFPPGWAGRSIRDAAYMTWLREILQAYGDVKPSMLQDFERGRTTEIDFINGYVVQRGQALGIPVAVNAAIVETVKAITRGDIEPDPGLLSATLVQAE
jgi:2-dehydropantoate 2-reductase